jgi:hypothetical protein
MNAVTDEDGRDDEPLPEDAEIDPPAEGEADRSDEVLSPFPGTDYNPIYGFSGVAAFEGTPQKDVLAERLPGEVLLEVKGKRQHVGALVTLVIGLVLLALVPPSMIFTVLEPGAQRVVSLALLLAGTVLVGVWVLSDLLFATDVDVTFTSEGVARHGKGADQWASWPEVVGWRYDGGRYVTLQCPGGTVPVPALADETRTKVIDLLEARKVPRL